ncbi:MAG: hypothetical protein CL920_21510 [Deltaproteobacteria bacterium]|nr:hypothetical protein [Deltaproteobacteria bacterium]
MFALRTSLSSTIKFLVVVRIANNDWSASLHQDTCCHSHSVRIANIARPPPPPKTFAVCHNMFALRTSRDRQNISPQIITKSEYVRIANIQTLPVRPSTAHPQKTYVFAL